MQPDAQCTCGHRRDHHGSKGRVPLAFALSCFECDCTMFEPVGGWTTPPPREPEDATADFLALTEPDIDEHDTSWVERHLGRCGCCASPETHRRLEVIADALTTDADEDERSAA